MLTFGKITNLLLYFLYKSLDHPSLSRLQPLFQFTNPHDFFANAFQTTADSHGEDSHGDRHLGHGPWGMRDKFKFYQ